ncbi:sialate O-acetylesterase [Aeoliella sp. ICT_H6.2]|uniref:Sialate O-acetylesterase n=1 Tax=Aeoliella straminimaris TaxID=2954799 RepID=A0A9X2FHD1_9BACT|nr:sialate O-acetylesterase [Aeoliella straminimaris]MCO6046759.1 sialate O-acetylesterase [Aeoliella straminimaris]
MTKLSCRYVLLLAVALPFSSAIAEEVDVYLLGGQSNMQGIAKMENLPEDVSPEIPHTYFFNGQEFEPLVLGKTRNSTRAGEFGPEVGFALATATSERPIYLIKYHASGMPLYHGWNGNQWEGGEPAAGRRNFYPGMSADDKNQGTLYRKMIRLFKDGLAQLEREGHTPRVRGFLWMQGEQDSKNEASATKYAESLARLQRRIVEDLALHEPLPMVFGQVCPHEPPVPRFTHRAEIRAAMARADGNSGTPDAIAQARMVSTDDCPLLPDHVHYNAAGQLQLGRKFAKAIGELQAKE